MFVMGTNAGLVQSCWESVNEALMPVSTNPSISIRHTPLSWKVESGVIDLSFGKWDEFFILKSGPYLYVWILRLLCYFMHTIHLIKWSAIQNWFMMLFTLSENTKPKTPAISCSTKIIVKQTQNCRKMSKQWHRLKSYIRMCYGLCLLYFKCVEMHFILLKFFGLFTDRLQ